jgi:hypothetical protein
VEGFGVRPSHDVITGGSSSVLVTDWPVLARRWYVVLVGVLAVLALCWGTAVLVPAQYDVTSTVLLLPPETIVDGEPVNPLMNLGGLDGVTDVLSTAFEDTSEAGLDAEYTVERDLTLAGPVVLVNVSDTSPKDALGVQTLLLDRLPVKLDELQEAVGVPNSARITSTVLTEDDTPKSNRKSQIRAVLVVAVVGLAGTYLAASALDGVILGRRRSRGARKRPGSPHSAERSGISNAPVFQGASFHDREPAP